MDQTSLVTWKIQQGSLKFTRWLLMGWLKAVTVINGLEQNMLVFIYCVENFVNISVQIINTVSEYAGVLPRLFSTMADRAC